MFLQVTYSRISKVVRQVFCKLLCQTLLTNALRTDEHQHRIWTLQNWQRSGHKDSRPDYASEMKDEVKYAQKIPCISELKQGSFASHSTVYVALWTEKSNLLNKQYFYQNTVQGQKVATSVRSAVFRPWHIPTIVLPLVYSPVDNMLIEVSPLFGCVKLLVVIETTKLVLSQFKNFLRQSTEKWIRSLCAKIISESCELVKLCHINRRGPVFFERQRTCNGRPIRSGTWSMKSLKWYHF